MENTLRWWWTPEDVAELLLSELEWCATMADEHVCGCGDHATQVADRIRKHAKLLTPRNIGMAGSPKHTTDPQ